MAKQATVRGAGSAREATVKGASTAGSAVTSAAKQLRTPAIVTGAGLAGLAGGIALARDRRKRMLGMKLPGRAARRATSKNLTEAARNVGTVAERTGQVAERVRVASEAISQQNARRRSPIEVVLEGLTTRSSPAARR